MTLATTFVEYLYGLSGNRTHAKKANVCQNKNAAAGGALLLISKTAT